MRSLILPIFFSLSVAVGSQGPALAQGAVQVGVRIGAKVGAVLRMVQLEVPRVTLKPASCLLMQKLKMSFGPMRSIRAAVVAYFSGRWPRDQLRYTFCDLPV